MTYPAYVRDESRRMRVESGLTIDELAERLAISRQTPPTSKAGRSWIRRLARNPVTYSLQYHADQTLNELIRFLGPVVEDRSERDSPFNASRIANQLKGRNWRSRHGVLTVNANDTLFRSRLQAWMDRVREEWLDSAACGA